MTAPATEKAAPILALLPCPFCGVDAATEEGEPGHFMAICMGCYCNVGENVEPLTGCQKHMFRSEDEAVAAWNTRADRASQEERIREDERDRLLERFRHDREVNAYSIGLLVIEGAMPPADRARLRGDAS